MINVGVIGTGWMMEKMANTIKFAASVNPEYRMRLYSVASHTYSRALLMRGKYGFEKAEKNASDLIHDDNVNLVYIATTNNFHFQLVKEALEAHKPVLCEKPIATNIADLCNLEKIARENHTFLAEGMWIRYLPIVKHIAEYVKSGALGNIISVSASLGYNIIDKKRISSSKLGGGAMLDLGIYPIAFTTAILGNKLDVVTGYSYIPHNDSVDLHNSGVLETWDRKQYANVMSSVIAAEPRFTSINCERGFVNLDSVGYPQSAVAYNADFAKVCEFGGNPSYGYELDAVADAIEHGLIETPDYTLDDIMATHNFAWSIKFWDGLQ